MPAWITFTAPLRIPFPTLFACFPSIISFSEGVLNDTGSGIKPEKASLSDQHLKDRINKDQTVSTCRHGPSKHRWRKEQMERYQEKKQENGDRNCLVFHRDENCSQR